MYFSRLFHLHPWDMRRLTLNSLLRHRAWVDEWIKANSKK